MAAALNVIVIYARDMQRTADFYRKFFGFLSSGEVVERLIELASADGGAGILIHQASKGIRLGQAAVKLSFSVRDVEAFKRQSSKLGLKFGATRAANGYSYANAKDPDGNSVAISSRAYRTRT